MFGGRGGGGIRFGTLPPGFQFIQGQGIPGMGGMSIQMPKPGGKRGQPKEREFYELLEVSPAATANEITKAFRKMARDKHPDKGGDADVYKKLSSAYDILSDEEKRLCYDAYGKDYEQVPHIEIFKQQLKNPDVSAPLEVTLKECICGKECKVYYNRLSSRGTPEKMVHQFYLPPGSMNNQKFTFPKMGHAEASKLPGNLIVIIQEAEQKEFKRYGNALIHVTTVDLVDVLSGKSISIEHPRGDTLFINPSSSFQTDQWYKIGGQGCTNSSPMFLQIKVKFPELTVEKRKQLMEVMEYKVKDMENAVVAEEVEMPDMEKELRQQQQDQHEAAEHHMGGPQGCPIQ